MHACERCYSRKTKCDRRLPQCGSCMRSRSLCQYSNKRQDRQLQQEYLQSVEKRLRALERENEQLRGELSWKPPLEPALDQDNAIQTNHHPSPSLPEAHQPSGTDPASELHRIAEQSPSQHAGSLQRTPGEETRYLGSSNGVDFVNVVERVVDSSHSGGLFERVTDTRSVPDAAAAPSMSQPAVLVDQGIAMPLIMSYFEHWHLTFPLLYRPAFMQMVQQMYSEPDFYRQHPDCAFVFDIVLALGSAPSKRFEWSFCDTESYFARALTRSNALSKIRDIRSLQALLLCCEYGIHASLRDTSSEMWHLLGKAARLCVELGLHRNSPAGLPKCNVHLTGLMPVSLQVEMQRRCFWCYYNLDRIVNVSLGRPLALHDDDIDVPFPSPLSDDSLDWADGRGDTDAPRTSPFLQHIDLRRIQAKIHRCMYTSRSTPTLSLTEKRAIRRDILHELETWRNRVSLLKLPSNANPAAISSGFLHSSWYQALYYSACLMLYRPSATFPAMEGLERDEEDDDVLQIIWNSSRNVLAKYFELLRARRLNYSWVCLYTIFMAGLANVYSVGRCAQRRKRGIIAFLPSYLDVVSDVRDCSNILTAICERWDDARSSCEIFNQLSTSALKELATVCFQQDSEGVSTRTATNPTITQTNMTPTSQLLQPEPMIDPSLNETSKYGAMDSDSTHDRYSDGAFSGVDPIVDFQQLFQDMQNSINTNGYELSNEVMLGFSQEWFER